MTQLANQWPKRSPLGNSFLHVYPFASIRQQSLFLLQIFDRDNEEATNWIVQFCVVRVVSKYMIQSFLLVNINIC